MTESICAHCVADDEGLDIYQPAELRETGAGYERSARNIDRENRKALVMPQRMVSRGSIMEAPPHPTRRIPARRFRPWILR